MKLNRRCKKVRKYEEPRGFLFLFSLILRRPRIVHFARKTWCLQCVSTHSCQKIRIQLSSVSISHVNERKNTTSLRVYYTVVQVSINFYLSIHCRSYRIWLWHKIKKVMLLFAFIIIFWIAKRYRTHSFYIFSIKNNYYILLYV